MELIDTELIKTEGPSYKKYSELTYQKQLRLVQKYGQLRNIVVRKDGEEYILIEGRNILKACIHLDLKQVWCKVIKSKKEEDQFIISMALNNLEFNTDFIILSTMFEEKMRKVSDTEKVSLTPFTDDQLEKIKAINEFDWKRLIKSKEDVNQTNLFSE